MKSSTILLKKHLSGYESKLCFKRFNRSLSHSAFIDVSAKGACMNVLIDDPCLLLTTEAYSNATVCLTVSSFVECGHFTYLLLGNDNKLQVKHNTIQDSLDCGISMKRKLIRRRRIGRKPGHTERC